VPSKSRSRDVPKEEKKKPERKNKSKERSKNSPPVDKSNKLNSKRRSLKHK